MPDDKPGRAVSCADAQAISGEGIMGSRGARGGPGGNGGGLRWENREFAAKGPTTRKPVQSEWGRENCKGRGRLPGKSSCLQKDIH